MADSPTEIMNIECPPGCLDARIPSQLIAAAADLALFVDQQGVIRDVSIGESIRAHASWNRLVGRRWDETIARDSLPKVEQLLQEARAGVVPRSREINQRAEGAGDIPFRFSAVLWDRTQQVVALGHDLRAVSAVQQQMISAQQAVDREFTRLRQAETRYRLLFQVSSEGVVVADLATRKILEINPAAVSILGELASELQGRRLDELFQPHSWPAVQALLAVADAGGRPTEVQVGLDGGRDEVLVSASMFRQSGAALALLRLRPIGAAGLALGGARVSRAMAVLEKLPDGFVVTGEDLRVLGANVAFCDLVQQPSENQIIGQPLDRWLGRPRVDLSILLANLREHGSVRNFSTILRGEYGDPQEAVVSAVSAMDAKVPCLGFAIRAVSARLSALPSVGLPAPRSIEQLRELVGRVPLKEILRESTDLIERLCIEAALKVSGDNRASAAQILGLSRQGFYQKLRRYGLGDLE